jgi:hypothetical protein
MQAASSEQQCNERYRIGRNERSVMLHGVDDDRVSVEVLQAAMQ